MVVRMQEVLAVISEHREILNCVALLISPLLGLQLHGSVGISEVAVVSFLATEVQGFLAANLGLVSLELRVDMRGIAVLQRAIHVEMPLVICILVALRSIEHIEELLAHLPRSLLDAAAHFVVQGAEHSRFLVELHQAAGGIQSVCCRLSCFQMGALQGLLFVLEVLHIRTLLVRIAQSLLGRVVLSSV